MVADIEVGAEAPDFTLRNEANEAIALSRLRGQPVVLVFYPLDFSPLCTNEMCAIRDDYTGSQEKGAQVFGISRDSVWTHKAFKQQQRLSHSLLADMKGDVARLYGAWNEAAGVAERKTIGIDKDGVIRHIQHTGLGEMRDQKAAVASIASISRPCVILGRAILPPPPCRSNDRDRDGPRTQARPR